MTAKILDGKAVASEIYKAVAERIKARLAKSMRAPGLAVIIIGRDPASKIYVKNKRQACQAVGIISKDFDMPFGTTEEELLKLIDRLNEDETVDGILVQLPLPQYINENKVLYSIRPDKDVDGFHPCNLGRLAQGQPVLRPCTPKGVMALLARFIDRDLQGIDAAIIGHSNIVGKPMALELLAVNATISVCHEFTKDIKPYVAKADLLISATGVPELIKGKWIKEGGIVVDIGVSRLAGGKVVGDIEFEEASKRASWITPVPGGVGPMTVATLMENTLYAADNLH